MILRALPLLSAALCLAGCATIDRGTLDDVAVITDPPGALVSASTGTICLSPCAVTAPRQTAVSVTISKSGYVTQAAVSAPVPLPTLAGAATFSVTPDMAGRAVDVQDGAYYTHEPKAIVVKLAPNS